MDNGEKKGQMHIDKMIRRELISLIVSTVLILLIFIGISFASFFSSSEGAVNTVSFGDIELTMCTDSTCEEGYGQVIGTTEDGSGNVVPSKIYPYETDALALESNPYIFKVENTGDLKLFVNAYLSNDTSFTPTGAYELYNNAAINYSQYIKIGINECPDGTVTTLGTNIRTFSSLTDGKVLDNVSINVGESKTYCLWTWLSNETPNSIQSSYFVANLRLSGEYLPLYTLLEKMNTASAKSDVLVDYSLVADTVENSGLFFTSDLTKTEDYDGDGTGERVYYYRGVVENNYVVFAGFCWRIVRTNEDGSIKLRYGGEPTGTSGNYTCPQTGTDVGINNQAGVPFNQTHGDNTYVGYMKGLNNDGTSTAENAQSNTYDSNIKSVIDDWYENNIANQGTNVTSKIANTIYCNDRNVGNPGTVEVTTFTSNAYGTNNVLYGAARRLATGGQNGTSFTSTNASPQYKCPNVGRDGFTLSVANGGTTGYGNNKLTYPVGLLTPDEVAYAGGAFWIGNTTYYLHTGQSYWTMGPFNWPGDYACVFNVYSSGDLGYGLVGLSSRAVPAVSLSSSALVMKGTGEYNSPYEIE